MLDGDADKDLNHIAFIVGPYVRQENARMFVSADNSPVLSKRMMSNTKADISDKISPSKMLIPKMDKFDIEITCPNEELFKAEVFKVWTSSQLSWKIAHVKGMGEKLALVVQEYITQLHLVRAIEDHEIVYDIIQNWAPDSLNKLHMVEDLKKFDMFDKPADFLPVEMLDVRYANRLLKGNESTKHNLFSFIVKADTSTDMHHWVFVKDFDKKTWKRMYLRIRDGVFYLCESEEKDTTKWTTLYNCKSSYLYSCLDEFKSAHKPPHKCCFCIIPAVVNKWKQIKCFSVESEKIYRGWLTGFRLAKYGQQIFKNFCEAMEKEETLIRTNSSRQSLFSRGRNLSDFVVATDNKATLDFSGDNSRVISDPMERLQIQNQLGFEIPRPVKRRSETFSPLVFRRAIMSNKVWYHGKISRELAIMRLTRNNIKGTFLVRESSTCQGNLVLSVVVRKGKISHHQIFQEPTPEGKPLYGMENGPQFTSLEQFIEAYNTGLVEGAEFTLKKPCPPT